jgi:hypothetical protein
MKECTPTTKRLTGDLRKKFTAHDGIVPSADETTPSFMQYTGKYPTILFRLLLMSRHVKYT